MRSHSPTDEASRADLIGAVMIPRNWRDAKRPAGATHPPVVSTQRTRRSLRSPHTLGLQREIEALASFDVFSPGSSRFDNIRPVASGGPLSQPLQTILSD